MKVERSSLLRKLDFAIDRCDAFAEPKGRCKKLRVVDLG